MNPSAHADYQKECRGDLLRACQLWNDRSSEHLRDQGAIANGEDVDVRCAVSLKRSQLLERLDGRSSEQPQTGEELCKPKPGEKLSVMSRGGGVFGVPIRRFELSDRRLKRPRNLLAFERAAEVAASDRGQQVDRRSNRLFVCVGYRDDHLEPNVNVFHRSTGRAGSLLDVSQLLVNGCRRNPASSNYAIGNSARQVKRFWAIGGD